MSRVRRPSALIELLILVGTVVGFTALHAAAGHDVAAAMSNAHRVQSIERALGLGIEVSANQWLAAHSVLIPPAVYVYRLYYAVLLAVVGWLYLRHPSHYRQARRALIVLAVLALLVYWALPMAPPRFAMPGIVDIVNAHDIFGRHTTSRGGNEYSAMPSMHVGWTSWCGYAVWSALRARHPRAAWLAWLFPAAMTTVVLGTGNHYVLDILAAWVLLAISVLVAARLWRYEPT